MSRSIAGHHLPISSSDQRLLTVFIQPSIQDDGTLPGPNLAKISYVAVEHPPVLHIEHPAIDSAVARNNGAGMAAPTLRSSETPDMEPYVRRAALLPGEGATVVLRIEILATGSPGRIQIEVSSNSRQIDQAAIDCARAQHWYAGRANGAPQVMWIRWAVRLQA
jgi:TonB family protein